MQSFLASPMRALIEALSTNEMIEELNFTGNKFSNKAVSAIATYIGKKRYA